MSFDIDVGSELVVLIYMVMNFLQAEMVGGTQLLVELIAETLFYEQTSMKEI